MRLELQYTRSASSAIWVDKLEGYDNDLLAQKILERGDEQDRNTNVQADMTAWKIPEFYGLCKDVAENHLKHLSGEIDVTWVVFSVWGANYRKGDYTRYHAHRPSTFSFCYYVKADEGASPLVFSELDYELHPEESQLVVFPSQLQHGVPSQRGEGRRMVIAGNIIAKYD
tara:strand:+ start:223 stop:732 length:510 start_codon:yes stop_codon:yes gene_type:complete